MSNFRKNFIIDVHNGKINVQNYSWVELEEKYNYETTAGAKPGDRARIHFKWYDTVGKNKGEWAPGKAIQDSDMSLGNNEPIEHSYLEPTENIINTREWQEFLAWKQDKQSNIDFTPGTYIVTGCNHVPFHNVNLLNAQIELIKDIQPIGLVLAGDFMDMNSISSHDKGQRPIADHITLSWEYSQGNNVLDRVIVTGKH